MKSIYFLITIVLILAASIYGWVANLVNVLSIEEITWTGQQIVQVIGIFIAPIGTVMGYLV